MKPEKLDPKFRRCLEFDDIRIGTVYEGQISDVEQIIKDEFSEMGLKCNFVSWDEVYTKIEELCVAYGSRFNWRAHPEYLFEENSLNVIYDCHFGPIPEQAPSKEEQNKAAELGEFISYYEGGSGRMSIETGKHYLSKNIRIFHLFRSRQEYRRHLRSFNTGREFAITCDSLFGDNER